MSTTAVNLPDMEQLYSIVEDIAQLTMKRNVLEVELKSEESRIVIEATTNQERFVGGKPPSMAFIDSTWKYGGFNNELLPSRKALAEVEASLDRAKLLFEFYKMLVDVYRTESANSRKVI